MNDFKEACILLNSPEDKYSYLIDLGKMLPAYPDEFRQPICLLRGCASKLYLHFDWNDQDQIVFCADSDSAIIKGVLYLLYKELNGRTRTDLSDVDINALLTDAGLFSLLSAQRQNGLKAMVGYIDQFIHSS